MSVNPAEAVWRLDSLELGEIEIGDRLQRLCQSAFSLIVWQSRQPWSGQWDAAAIPTITLRPKAS
jgi:hypothetical protein